MLPFTIDVPVLVTVAYPRTAYDPATPRSWAVLMARSANPQVREISSLMSVTE
jgi:hypothetical protein